MMVGCFCAEACTAAVLVLCVSLAVLSTVLGAWSVRCVGRVDWVDGGRFPSCVFLGGARRLEISPCNTGGGRIGDSGMRRGALVHVTLVTVMQALLCAWVCVAAMPAPC